MNNTIFDFKNYKLYLQSFIESRPYAGRGVRMAMAKHLSSPVSHISQILNGKSQLTLDQAESMNDFIGHTQEEAQFFFLLIELEKASTEALRKRLFFQMQQILEKRLILKDRLGVKQTLTKEDQIEFYSSWIYGAIHVMLTIPKFQRKESIAHHLNLPIKRVTEVLHFLKSVGLCVEKNNGRFDIGSTHLHLGADSPLISKFHTNWRIKAIQALEKNEPKDDLHYSSAITVSAEDAFKIKSLIVKHLEEIKKIIRESPAEGVHCFNIDFYQL